MFEGKKFSAKVLVVDDYLMNLKLAQRYLERAGCEVEAAEDGEEALDLYDESEFDLIFLDIQMPQMDGYEVARTIRQKESGSGRHTPIVALTANSMEHDREKCLKAGMDDYVCKPLGKIILEEILKKYVSSGN